MAFTILTPQQPHAIDFYLPDHTGLIGGFESTLLVTLVVAPPDCYIHPVEDLVELWVGTGGGVFRYTAIFPQRVWESVNQILDNTDLLTLRHSLLSKLTDRHNLDLLYAGGVRWTDALTDVGRFDTLPIFDQYYDTETYTDWCLKECWVGNTRLLQLVPLDSV